MIGALANGRDLATLQESASGTQPVARFTGLSVLVADDSEVNREVAQAALQKLGVTPDLPRMAARRPRWRPRVPTISC